MSAAKLPKIASWGLSPEGHEYAVLTDYVERPYMLEAHTGGRWCLYYLSEFDERVTIAEGAARGLEQAKHRALHEAWLKVDTLAEVAEPILQSAVEAQQAEQTVLSRLHKTLRILAVTSLLLLLFFAVIFTGFRIAPRAFTLLVFTVGGVLTLAHYALALIDHESARVERLMGIVKASPYLSSDPRGKADKARAVQKLLQGVARDK